MSGSPPSDDLVGSYRARRVRVAGLGAAVAFLAAVVGASLRYRPSRVAIEGPSMAPTLLPGDWALVVTPGRYHRGDVVVVEHPGRPGYEMVKRITAGPGDAVGERTLGEDEWWVEGDFPQGSTDSRHFGTVTGQELKAKVVAVYWPASRRGAVR
jgi:signal peptidase I